MQLALGGLVVCGGLWSMRCRLRMEPVAAIGAVDYIILCLFNYKTPTISSVFTVGEFLRG